ncbi:MAG: LysR family transcriptional regulator [Pseudomonadota bacterium]
MDWDKLRIFHAAADAGSFTHAGDRLQMSQSAVSRQVSALEHDLGVPLFHRHARGLILTEQGELLHRTVRSMTMQLQSVRTRLTDTKEKPSGELKVTTTVGLGTTWLASRLGEFVDLYPSIRLQLLLTDKELDIGMREADVAIRLRQPVQPDIIQRRLFTVHFHLYASPNYLKQFGTPGCIADLEHHRLITFGPSAPIYLRNINWLETAGRTPENRRETTVRISNVVAIKRAVQGGVGIAMLPDYLVEPDSNLVQLMDEAEVPTFDCYFAYPEELRNSARIQAFRDFMVSQAEHWRF